MARSSKIALTSFLIALGVTLSFYPGAIPAGPTQVLPYQHMINVITGILLGPWYAIFTAASIGILRFTFGVGTIFAFPGGIPGALVVGLVYHYLTKSDLAAFTEPIGTGIGALLSALIVQPMFDMSAAPPFLGLTAQWQIFLALFWFSSVPGAIMGFVIIVALRKRGIIQRFQFQ
jgi:energy coupling factor transporter S component ThiW